MMEALKALGYALLVLGVMSLAWLAYEVYIISNSGFNPFQ